MAARATIGALIVSVGANTGPFEKGMKRTKKGLDKFQKSASATTRAMSAMKLGLAGVFGGFAASKLVSQFTDIAESIDELSKASLNLGIATEQLGGLQHAAQLSGVDVSALNKSLKRMVISVADADQGLGRGVKALADLQLNVKQLAGLSPDKMFTKIADALGSIEDNTEKIAIADAIFGRNGAELINLLDQGAVSINEMAESYKNLGGAISDQDALNVAEMNDSLTRLKTLAGGFGNKIVITVAPAVTETVNALMETIEGIKELRKRPAVKKRESAAYRAMSFPARHAMAQFGIVPTMQASAQALETIAKSRYMRDRPVTQPTLVGPQRPTVTKQPLTSFGGTELKEMNQSLKALLRVTQEGAQEGETGDRVYFRPKGIYIRGQSAIGP